MLNFFKETTVALLLAATATGTTTIDSGGVDTAEFDGVAFILSLGSFNAGNYVKVQGSADNITFTDIAGSKVTPTANNTGLCLCVERSPAYRYYQVEIVRAGATTIISAIYSVLYRTKGAPLTSNTGVQLVAAVAGTA